MINWTQGQQTFTVAREDGATILLVAENVLGSRLFVAFVVEGPSTAPVSQILEHGCPNVLGDKYRTLAGAQKACAAYLRRRRKSVRPVPAIHVVEAADVSDFDRQVWASLVVPQA